MPFDILNPSVGDLVVPIDAANMPTDNPCIYKLAHMAMGERCLVLYTATELTERYATVSKALRERNEKPVYGGWHIYETGTK